MTGDENECLGVIELLYSFRSTVGSWVFSGGVVTHRSNTELLEMSCVRIPPQNLHGLTWIRARDSGV